MGTDRQIAPEEAIPSTAFLSVRMKNARAYLGFVPAVLVGIPWRVAEIRQALFYKGCMDGFAFVMVAFLAFVAGGILNAVFLLYAGWLGRRYFDFADRRHVITARAGVVVSGLLLVVQLAVVLYFAWKRKSP